MGLGLGGVFSADESGATGLNHQGLWVRERRWSILLPMERLDYDQFVAARHEFDDVVALSGGMAGSCWWSPWQIAAHDSMGRNRSRGVSPGEATQDRKHLIYRTDRAWLALVEFEVPGVYVPFEQTWMFGCPLVGEPRAAMGLLAAVTQAHQGELRGIMLGGVPKGGELQQLLGRVVGEDNEQEGTESCLIDLSGGVDPWLARRSRNFRRTAQRATLPPDISVVDALVRSPDFGAFLKERDDALAFHLMLDLECYDLSDRR